MGESNAYKLNVSVLRACDRGTIGEPLRLPRSRPGLARAARALRDTRADPPDDRRIPFCPLVPAGPTQARESRATSHDWGYRTAGRSPGGGQVFARDSLVHQRAPYPITPKPYWLRQPCWHPMLSVDSVRTVFHRSRGIFSLGPPNHYELFGRRVAAIDIHIAR